MPTSPQPYARQRIAWILLSFLGLGVFAAWGWSSFHLSRAECDAANHRNESASRHLAYARQTWPVDSFTFLLAARVERRLGRLDRARAELKEHERHGGYPNDRSHEEKLIRAQEGDVEGQETELFEILQANHSGSSDILEAMARGYLAKNHESGLARLLPFWSDDRASPRWRGRARFVVGEYPEAIADFNAHLASNPNDDKVRLELAQACYRSGRSAESVAHWRVLQRRPQPSPQVLLGLALALQDQSEFAEAETVLDALLKKNPDHPEALVERSRVALRQGQAALGERIASRVLDHYPQAPDPYLMLANCLEAQGEKAESLQKRKRWQEIDSAGYHLNLIMPQLGRTPNDARWNYQAGSCLAQLGNAEMAVEALENALRSDPGHRPSHRVLAECYAKLGQFERAKKHQQAAGP